MTKQETEIKSVYDELELSFDGCEFIKRVRVILDKPQMYDGTILRILRKLRIKGKIDYQVVDRRHSKYSKKQVDDKNYGWEIVNEGKNNTWRL